jgi:hypothetical protein
MKTMKLGENLPIRVKEADVKRHEVLGYTYCSRKEWKEKVRDLGKAEKFKDHEKAEKILK